MLDDLSDLIKSRIWKKSWLREEKFFLCCSCIHRVRAIELYLTNYFLATER